MFLESGRAIAAQVQFLVDQEVTQPIRVAVAFWGTGADFKLRGACRIICDLASGLCNPVVIASLLDRDNAVVLQLPGLHAKVVVGSAGAVISSANMSINGLGAEGADASGTIEAGYFVAPDTPDHRQVSAWFEEQWAHATDISEDDLAAAALRWESRNREILAPEAATDRPSALSFAIEPSALLEGHIDPRDRLAAVKPSVFNVLKESLPNVDHRRLGKIATWACHLLLNRAGAMQQHGPGDGEAHGPATDAWICSRFGTTKRAETRAAVAMLLASISRSPFFSRDVRRAATEILRDMSNDAV
jgi:hypothetical protein